MKQTLLLMSFSGLLFLTQSCTSEYEERLEKAKDLKSQLEKLEANESIPEQLLFSEVAELKHQIEFHAKVSGNKELFMKEVFGY